MTRHVLAALTLGLALSLAGCTAAPPLAQPTAVEAQAEIPNVVGLDGSAANKALEAAGFVVEFDAGTEVVIIKSNWTVDSQSPTGSAATGSTVILKVSKHSDSTDTTNTGTFTDEEIVASLEAPEHWGQCLADLGATGPMTYVPDSSSARFPGTATIYAPAANANLLFKVATSNQNTILSTPATAADAAVLATVGC